MESEDEEAKNAIEFYDRIKMLVKLKNTTLLMLCEMSDFNLSTYNVSRKRQRFLKGDVIARMADILGVSTDFLITGREHGQTLSTQQVNLWQMMCALDDGALADIAKLTSFYLRDQQEKKANPAPKPRPLMKQDK